MKKKLIISLLSLLITTTILSETACSQRSSSVLGSGEPEYIFRFEVVDSESHWPVKNARISLAEKDRDITTIFTGRSGIGIVVVNNSRYLSDIGRITVVARQYKYWEKNLMSVDLYEGRGERIGIPANNWNVDASMIVDALRSGSFIRKGNYRDDPGATFHSDNLVNVGDYYEFKIYMDKIKDP